MTLDEERADEVMRWQEPDKWKRLHYPEYRTLMEEFEAQLECERISREAREDAKLARVRAAGEPITPPPDPAVDSARTQLWALLKACKERVPTKEEMLEMAKHAFKARDWFLWGLFHLQDHIYTNEKRLKRFQKIEARLDAIENHQGGLAGASRVADLQARVDNLEKQIASLRIQATAAASASASNLRRGYTQ